MPISRGSATRAARPDTRDARGIALRARLRHPVREPRHRARSDDLPRPGASPGEAGDGRRGGYCFEQNALFAAVLESLGFEVMRLAARVRFGATEIRPRTAHAARGENRRRALAGRRRLRRCGPALSDQAAGPGENQQGAWTFRMRTEGDEFVLESKESDGWLDLYAFTREPQYPVDYEIGNHYTSTHPHSPFVQNLVVQKGSLELALDPAQPRADRAEAARDDDRDDRRRSSTARPAGESIRPAFPGGHAIPDPYAIVVGTRRVP